MPQAIDWNAWSFVLAAVQLVGVVLVWIYAWWANRHKVIQSDHAALERRVSKIEQDMEHQPGRGEFDKLSERIGMVHADLQELVGSFRGVQRAVDLMHQHLLDRSSR